MFHFHVLDRVDCTTQTYCETVGQEELESEELYHDKDLEVEYKTENCFYMFNMNKLRLERSRS